MINIYKEFIKNNIDKLTINDLKKYAEKNHIECSQYELIIIFNFIKYNYNELLNDNIKVIENIKDKINPSLYKKLVDMYVKYMNKYIKK